VGALDLSAGTAVFEMEIKASEAEDDGDGFGVGVGVGFLHGEGIDCVLVQEALFGVVHGVEAELVEEVLAHVSWG
jgi:hypothetical protein